MAFARNLLKQEGVSLPADLAWSGGMDYAKASRLRKRDCIQTELEMLRQQGRLTSGQTVLALGDSTSDDFLELTDFCQGRGIGYLPVYFGSAATAFPGSYVARYNGQDRQHAQAFSPLVRSLLKGQWPSTTEWTLRRD